MAAHVWPLCERHADNLRVPRGWFCVDRRASRFGPPEGEVGPSGPATADALASTAPRPRGATSGGTRDNDAVPGTAPDETAGNGDAGPKGGGTAKGPGTGDVRKRPGPNGGGRLSSIL
jgi:hypothetical protein